MANRIRLAECKRRTYHRQLLAALDVALREVLEGAGGVGEGENKREERTKENDVRSQRADGEHGYEDREGEVIECCSTSLA